MEKKMRILIGLVLAVALTASIAQAQDITTGLQGYWPFEEGEGTTTADVTGNGYNGTFLGHPEWVEGPEGFGSAIQFRASGQSDGIECGTCNPSDGTGVFTLALWAYWNGPAGIGTYDTQHFLTKGGYSSMWQWEVWSEHLNSDYTDRVGMSYTTAGSKPFSLMPADEWVHLAFTFDGSDLTLYINGEPDGTGPQPFSIGTDEDSTFYIGVSNVGTRSFDGRLDDVRVYNRVLGLSDIQQLAAPDPDFNFAPQVDAGEYQSILWPVNSAQLDATVSDDGKPADPCMVTITWSKLSGPGTVEFSDAGIEDPTATFSVGGMYELQLSATDGEKDACDVVAVYVRPDDNPIAHWAFEEGNDLTVGDSSAYNNIGTFVGEPNWVPGWVGDWALECSDNSYVNITVDPTADPNLDSQVNEITVAAWLKVDSWLSPSWNGIVTKGDGGAGGNGGWSLIRNSSNDSLSFYAPTAGYVGGSISVKDSHWHHVAAVHNGVTVSLYVDGVLDTSAAASGPIATTTAEVWINGNSEYPGTRYFSGNIDDVRVYSYGLSAAQVADLAAMGSLIPIVDAGEDQVFSMQNDFVQLDGTVTDDGNPVAATLEWTQESGPGTVTFSDTGIVNPTATFSEVGTYVLRLTADDTMAAIYDEVTIEVENPTCQDVIDDGLLMIGDISGPEGTPDCRVNLYDFSAFAGNWLRCNNPQDTSCEFPF